jgi:hypothetical protein
LEGVVPENRDFSGPEMATSETIAICAKKVENFKLTPSNGPPCNGFSPIDLLGPVMFRRRLVERDSGICGISHIFLIDICGEDLALL